MDSSPIIVGIGEVLWDLLPSGRQLGGAPANFAYCAHLLGNCASVVSRVGRDLLGEEIRERLQAFEIPDQFIQSDSVHATGTVNVEVDAAGQPTFEIKYPAAWDFIEWNLELGKLAHSCHAVCFGTLAQRSEQSSNTILKFLDATQDSTLRVFDVNLRQSYYSRESLEASFKRANIAKLNEHELPTLAGLFKIPECEFCTVVLETFGLNLICVTRGENGSVLFSRNEKDQHPGFRVAVKDTVGAGDAFTAGLVHEFLRSASLTQMNETANRIGAWVASRSGGMPDPPPNLHKTLNSMREA